MKKLSFVKSLATVGLAAVCAFGVVGCASGESDGAKQTYTGGVAATVNGTEISEDTITAAIEGIRDSMGLTDDEAWGEWLAENDYTPESVRKEIIDSYVDQELVKQGAESMDIHADEDTVNQYVDSMRQNYDSDEAWAQALEAVGMTEDEYRDNIELSLVTQEVRDNVTANAEDPTDEELLTAAQTYVPSYNGAKKSSHILFDAADEAQAQEVLEKLQSGELDFAEAAKTYSKDTASAEDGGNVGWDKLTSFVTEYQDALNDLEKGEMSGLVPSTYGIHIIECTDTFEAPEELKSLDELPAEFQEAVKSMLASSNQQQVYYTWVEDQRNGAEIVINDMPEDVPYFVDMTNFQKEESDEDNGITAVDADGNPVDIQTVTPEGADGEAAVDEGVEGAAEGAEGEAAEAAQEAEGAEAGEGQQAEGDQQAAEGDNN